MFAVDKSIMALAEVGVSVRNDCLIPVEGHIQIEFLYPEGDLSSISDLLAGKYFALHLLFSIGLFFEDEVFLCLGSFKKINLPPYL